MAEPSAKDKPRRGSRWWGRRAAQVTYYAAATAIACAATIQITQQIFFAEAPAGPPPFATCGEGIRALFEAIERGRAAANWRGDGHSDDDPEEALTRYRDAVRPVWAHRPALDELCGKQHGGLLDALERLRYSEEHGVRHQAVELTALRRRVRDLVAENLPAGVAPHPKPDLTP